MAPILHAMVENTRVQEEQVRRLGGTYIRDQIDRDIMDLYRGC